MSWEVKGLWHGEEVSARWNAAERRIEGDDLLWEEVKRRSHEPLPLTPVGPVLERPNPNLPGHALALVASIIRLESVEGRFPALPEGMRASDFGTTEGAVQ